MNRVCLYRPMGGKGSKPGLPFYSGPMMAMWVAMLFLSACQPASEEFPNPFPPATQIASFGNLPRWSPDGQKLIFGADGAQTGIWLYDRSGSSLTQVTDADHPHLYDYRISEGNDKIAFGGAGASIENTSGIWVVGLDGSDAVRWHATGHSPSWMPNDEGLVFVENDPQSGSHGLFRLVFADSSITRLTFGGIDPVFSPAGAGIAYRELLAADTVAYKLKIYTAMGISQVLADTCLHFAWTVDGSYLIYDLNFPISFKPSDPGFRICKIGAMGGVAQKIIQNATQPAVGFNERIAYLGVTSDLSQGIFSAQINGSDIWQMSPDGYQPDCNPTEPIIAFAHESGIWLVEY